VRGREKPDDQALDRTAPSLPVLPTTPARMTHDYVRHGTTSLFAALDVASGSVVRRAHHPQAPPLRAPQRHRARNRHPQMDHRVEQEPRPFVWTKTADAILESLAAYCQRISVAGY
jgi:hypothetical protein